MSIIEQSYESLREAIPSNVLELIENSTEFAKIFPINQNERCDKQILKADEFVFQPNASLILTKIESNFIVLIAKNGNLLM